MEDRLRVRSADDPENPEALVIERFERLKLKNDHLPSGWVVIAWHPNRAALAESAERLKAAAQEQIGSADSVLAQLEPGPSQATEHPWIFGSSTQATAVDEIGPDGEPLWHGKPAVTVRIGHQWLDKARAVLAEQGGFWLWVRAEGGDPKTTPVLGESEVVASPKAREPTMADVVGVFDRRTARAIDAKLEAFRREQVEDAKLLIEQWQAVMERFGKDPQP